MDFKSALCRLVWIEGFVKPESMYKLLFPLKLKKLDEKIAVESTDC